MQATSDSRTFAFATPLAGGDMGVAQTIEQMRQLVDAGVKDPTVNRYAIEIIRNCPAYDRLAKVRCLYDFVLANYLYVEDPVGPLGPKEVLRPPAQMIHLRAGDCDDFSILLATLVGTIGYESRFVTVAADPQMPEAFSHIYPEANVDGQWFALDAARPGASFGREPERYFRKKIWPNQGSAQEVTGVGRVHSLNGYMGLGQQANETAQDITAMTTGISDIELASNPVPGTVYANLSPGAGVSAVNPLLATGYGEYGVYPSPISPITSLFSNPTFLALLAGGVALLLLERSRH